MQCIKCGRDIEEPDVFCSECLAGMEKYPVRPGTVVQLPKRQEQPVRKQPQRRKPTVAPEEQLKLLRKWARLLALALVLCLLLLIGAGYLLVQQYIDQETELLPGQNYSSALDNEGTEGNR